MLRRVPIVLQGLGIVLQPLGVSSSPSATTETIHKPTASLVGVNEGFLVTGSVHLRGVPVPNSCVELRGYHGDAAESLNPTGSTAAANTGSIDTAASSHTWPEWVHGEPQFLELQRTGENDGSFLFLAPETGMRFLLAVYSGGGASPDLVRAFPDIDHDPGGSVISGRGNAQAPEDISRYETAFYFGVESGRVQMHIDLTGAEQGAEFHPPEAPWSSPPGNSDRSPCAKIKPIRTGSGDGSSSNGEEKNAALPASISSGISGATTGAGGDSAVHQAAASSPLSLRTSSQFDAARGGGDVYLSDTATTPDATPRGYEELSPMPNTHRWPSFDRVWYRIFHFFDVDFDGSIQRVTNIFWAQIPSSCRVFLRQLCSIPWEAFGAINDAAKEDGIHEVALAASPTSSKREISARLERIASELLGWIAQRQSLFISERFWQPIFSVELRSPVCFRGWWTIWWARIVATAVLFGMLQQMLVLMCRKCCSSISSMTGGVHSYKEGGAIGAVDVSRSCSESACQESANKRPMVATFYGPDGRVSQLEIAMSDDAGEKSVTPQRRSLVGAMLSKSESERAVELEDDEDGREEEDGGEFSSMFRALDQPSSMALGRDEGRGGSVSSVFVVSRERW